MNSRILSILREITSVIMLLLLYLYINFCAKVKLRILRVQGSYFTEIKGEKVPGVNGKTVRDIRHI
jgi:hypothetical protein